MQTHFYKLKRTNFKKRIY